MSQGDISLSDDDLWEAWGTLMYTEAWLTGLLSNSQARPGDAKWFSGEVARIQSILEDRTDEYSAKLMKYVEALQCSAMAQEGLLR